jgi:formylglycine-generating enzyme required for sulfatase activity
MRAALHIAGLLLALCVTHGAEPEMARIPDSIYRPLFRGEKDAKEIAVTAFQLDAQPVTNGEFLDFVRANPQWQRSRVKRLFADKRYLAHWAGDLELGDARAAQPVTNVSWFAAKAFAVSRGKRLPTTAEWEVAAAVGFTLRDGTKDAEFQTELARWYATPSPAVLPDAGAGRANVFGVRDLHGLVWEWTSDFNSAMVTGDARGDSGLERQLFCGAGSIGAKDPANFPAFMRFGFRSSLKAAYTVHNLGFRIAADEKPAPCCLVEKSASPPHLASDRSLYQLGSTWTSDDAHETKLDALRGRPQVLALFFASCEFSCPILVHELKALEESLPAELRDAVGFTLVSIDPERDTPTALRAYRERLRLSREHWTLLRGNADDVRALAAATRRELPPRRPRPIRPHEFDHCPQRRG